MNYDNIKDYRLQKKFKKIIIESGKGFNLRTFLQCGHVSASERLGVSIIKNHKHTRIVGAKMCRNSWACPVCSAIQMSKTAGRIAAAIDALSKTHYAIMITFTVFHSINDTCAQVFDLLYSAWGEFFKDRRRSKLGLFLNRLEIKHYVRCAEVTHSNNGWHPHFHCLFWVPKKYINSVLQYEEPLRISWRHFQERVMKKIWGYTKYNAFEESETLHGEGAAGVYISKNNGKPTIQKSSDYLCGWGADKELTGNFQKKATGENSRTPYQILQDIYDKDDLNDKKLYLEFAEYVIKNKRRRFDFGRNGLQGIINNFINATEYREVMKKKRIQYREGAGAWELVIWFTSIQWLQISRIDRTVNFSLIELILCFAKYENGYDLINELLKVWQIPSGLNFDPVGYHDAFINLLNDNPYIEKDKRLTMKEWYQKLTA